MTQVYFGIYMHYIDRGTPSLNFKSTKDKLKKKEAYNCLH